METIKEEIDETDHHHHHHQHEEFGHDHEHDEEFDLDHEHVDHDHEHVQSCSETETESESEDDWTDFSDDVEKRKFKENKIGKRNRSKKNLPEVVQRRVKALKKSQFEVEKLEAKFYRELFYLESEFNLTKREPILEKRNQIINKVDSFGGRLENFW